MAQRWHWLRGALVSAFCFVLAACGGGGGGGGNETVTHTVTATQGVGGSISPSSKTVNDGNSAEFTLTPDTGYVIANVDGCGGSLDANTNIYNTGAITTDCTVNATFIATHTISATHGTGGSISPSSKIVNDGDSADFTVTPDTGYAVANVDGCGGSLDANTNIYTTGAITSDCTVNSNFVATHTVSTTHGIGGSISSSGKIVNDGGSADFTVTPDTGYVIANVDGCSGSLNGTTFTTGAVTADCTVTASFSLEFAWMGGSDLRSAWGIYGTLNTADPKNIPGARWSVTAWSDTSGNLWLFGGVGFDSAGNQSVLNDLWEYSNGLWTWVGGSKVARASGVYGTQGIASASNIPGARYSAISWSDASGNLWLFGGEGYDSSGTRGNLNDLWKYSPSDKQWTWMGGSETINAKGSYGTRGTPDAGNYPGARAGAISWIDASGNVWLFGGAGADATGATGQLNDLWEYSPSSGLWAWMGGSDTANASGVYGTRGAPDTANMPGARSSAISWVDASGKLWLFGGYGYDSTGTWDDLNDLWEYSPSGGQWTWVGGSNIAAVGGVYGTQGIAAAGNIPGARDSATGWRDTSGNLWLFGGSGLNSAGNWDYLNELWEYSPTSGQWTWVKGSDADGVNGVYGTQGVPSSGNVPTARQASASWISGSGDVWLFGGDGNDSAGNKGFLNDLWSFHP